MQQAALKLRPEAGATDKSTVVAVVAVVANPAFRGRRRQLTA